MPDPKTRTARSTPTRVGKTAARIRQLALHDRSTPTRVGKTPRCTPGTPALPVHPHARGENGNIWDDTDDIDGPPPRAWGKRWPAPGLRPYSRSTPTRVGKTAAQWITTTGVRVHPHARGENVKGRPPLDNGNRSTPTRVGKTIGVHLPERVPVRSTPTRVGKTGSGLHLSAMSTGPPPRAWGKRAYSPLAIGKISVHPHARGENALIHLALSLASVHPHARGENAEARPAQPRCAPVHPHARGENWLAVHDAGLNHGPPPRAWGKRGLSYPSCPRCRSTPTRVGKTDYREDVHLVKSGPPPRAWGKRICSCCTTSILTVHPHARGENVSVVL